MNGRGPTTRSLGDLQLTMGKLTTYPTWDDPPSGVTPIPSHIGTSTWPQNLKFQRIGMGCSRVPSTPLDVASMSSKDCCESQA